MEEIQSHLNQKNKGVIKSILIAEDDRISALLLRRILESKGYKVDHAETGTAALDLFRKNKHKLVITDWMMPEMDGLELCRQIRLCATKYVYIVLLTAKSQRESRAEAYAAGIDDFLTKPLDKDDLIACLEVADRIIGTDEQLIRQKKELEAMTERLAFLNRNMELASKRFEELFAGLPVSCFTFDRNGVVFEWNRTSEVLFGIPPYEAFLKCLWEILANGTHPLWNQEMVNRVFNEERVSGEPWQFQRADGTQIELESSIIPLIGPTGDRTAAISVNIDVTERNKSERLIKEYTEALKSEQEKLLAANRRLELLAISDGLTGLWNHRHFQEQLDKEVRKASAGRSNPSVIMLDVDHFKQYNDTFGHPEGDVVLKVVSEILQNETREGTDAARYGGEEFVLIMNRADEKVSVNVAERVRRKIEDYIWPRRKVTASIGVSSWSTSCPSAATLIKQADEALYYSKTHGRNRVTHFKDIPKNEELAA